METERNDTTESFGQKLEKNGQMIKRYEALEITLLVTYRGRRLTSCFGNQKLSTTKAQTAFSISGMHGHYTGRDDG